MSPDRKIQPTCPEVVSELREKLFRQGITHVLFDLDDTLLDTVAIFINAREEALKILDPVKGPTLASQFKNALAALKNEFHVNPVVMQVPLVNCALSLGLRPDNPKVISARDRIAQIHDGRDQYTIFPGARETVAALSRAGTTPVLASHGSDAYTGMKLRQAGIAHLFALRASFSQDEAKAGQWQNVFDQIGVNPRKTLVIGDSLKNDITPAVKLGAKTVWINKGLNPRTRFDNDFATEIAIVEKISQVVPALIGKPAPRTK